jgi:hypothetical protein
VPEAKTEVKVGQIVVTVDPVTNTARLACGAVGCAIGSAAGQRFFDELSKIREALTTAHKVLVRSAGGATSPDEMHLVKLLVDLEVVLYQEEIT